MSTTSGRVARARSIASSAVGGLADDLDVVLDREDHREARAHHGVVVDEQDPSAGVPSRRSERVAHADPVAARHPRPDVDLPVVGGRPLADAELAEPAAGRAVPRPAVVDDLDLGVRRRTRRPAPRRRRCRRCCGDVRWSAPPAPCGRSRARCPGAAGSRRTVGSSTTSRSTVRPSWLAWATSSGRSPTPASDVRVAPAGSVPSSLPSAGPSRSVPSRRRIWASASREASSTFARAVRAASGSRSRTRRAAPAWMPIAETSWRDDVVQLAGDAQPLVEDGLLAQPAGLGGDGRRLLLQPQRVAGPLATTPRHRRSPRRSR